MSPRVRLLPCPRRCVEARTKLTRLWQTRAERELLGDLVLLQEDLDRLGDEEEADFDASDEEGSSPRRARRLSTASQRIRRRPSAGLTATSGGSDSEEDLGEEERSGEDDEDTEERKKGTFARLLNDPREYSEAARAGRKTARQRRQKPDTSASRSRAVAGAGKASKRRARALSSASETGDLLGLEEEREDANGELTTGDDVTDAASSIARRPALATVVSDSAAAPSSPTKARRSSMSKGARRALSQIMGGTFLTEEESPAQGAGWDGLSDWAIDTRIMFKRRLAALFTVSLASSACHGPVPITSQDGRADETYNSRCPS